MAGIFNSLRAGEGSLTQVSRNTLTGDASTDHVPPSQSEADSSSGFSTHPFQVLLPLTGILFGFDFQNFNRVIKGY